MYDQFAEFQFADMVKDVWHSFSILTGLLHSIRSLFHFAAAKPKCFLRVVPILKPGKKIASTGRIGAQQQIE
jgi:hypothetical protein